MKRSVALWELFGFAVSSVLGTLLHFLYDLTGESAFAAAFCAVNESTFEHMKLFFWPTFVFAVVQSFFFRGYGSFWCVKLREILLGLVLIPTLFYTYNGVIGKSPDLVNIAIFFISAAIAYIYGARRLGREDVVCKAERLSFFILCVIALLFVVFTFYTPHIDLFKDPMTGGYGI